MFLFDSNNYSPEPAYEMGFENLFQATIKYDQNWTFFSTVELPNHAVNRVKAKKIYHLNLEIAREK